MSSNSGSDWYSSLLGGLGSSALNIAFSGYGARRQYKYAKKLQNKQNDFTERMANTAHQREVADLEAAGLNPILSATGGNGAATPSSGTGAVIGDDLSDTVSTALEFKRLQNETQLKDSQTSLNHSAQELNRADEWYKRAMSSLVQEQARNESERYNNIVQDRINSILKTEAEVLNLNSGSSLNKAMKKFTDERSRGYTSSHGVKLPLGLGGYDITESGNQDLQRNFHRSLSEVYGHSR